MPTSQIVRCTPPPVKTGTCELCGGHNRQLRILVLWDYIGWTCPECIDQVSQSQTRRFVAAGEHTEPTE